MTDIDTIYLDLYCFAIPPARIGNSLDFPRALRGWLICVRERGHDGPHEGWISTLDDHDLKLVARWFDARPMRLDLGAIDRPEFDKPHAAPTSADNPNHRVSF